MSAASTSKASPVKKQKKNDGDEKPENQMDEVVPKVPDLKLSNDCYQLVHGPASAQQKNTVFTQQILPVIKEHGNVTLYQSLCEELKFAADKTLLEQMSAANKVKLDAAEKEIEDAEKNLGETEVRNSLQRKAELQCQMGDKEGALSTFRHTFDKTVGIGNKLDMTFQQIRIGFFYEDEKLVSSSVERSKELLEQGGDWDRKNRLKAYEALHCMSVRDFAGAAALFLDSVPTFDSPELMTYERLVFYAVVCCTLALDRRALKDKVIKGPEIQEQLTGGGKDGSLRLMKDYVQNFYELHYDRFFKCLAELEEKELKYDKYLAAHYKYYVRAMRIKAYEQYLTPYTTVTTGKMASSFGVTPAYIDSELHKLIASGSLHCRIDAVRGIVETNRPDSKNELYQTLIREGDLLGARIQRLAAVINE